MKAARGVDETELGGTVDDSALSATAHQGEPARPAARHLMQRYRDIPAGSFPSNLTPTARRLYGTAVQRYGEPWLERYGSRDAAEQWNSALETLRASEIRSAWYTLMRQSRSGLPTPSEFRAMARVTPRRPLRTPETLARGIATLAECRAILARAQT